MTFEGHENKKMLTNRLWEAFLAHVAKTIIPYPIDTNFITWPSALQHYMGLSSL